MRITGGKWAYLWLYRNKWWGLIVQVLWWEVRLSLMCCSLWLLNPCGVTESSKVGVVQLFLWEMCILCLIQMECSFWECLDFV